MAIRSTFVKSFAIGSLLLLLNGAATISMAEDAIHSPAKQESAREVLSSISISGGGKVISAELFDNATSRDFLALLPLTLAMSRWGDREYYGKPGAAISTEVESQDGFSNGDVTYWVPGGSFALFFDKGGASDISDLIVIGKITSDLAILKGLGQSVEMTIERSEPQRVEP